MLLFLVIQQRTKSKHKVSREKLFHSNSHKDFTSKSLNKIEREHASVYLYTRTSYN